MNGARDLAYGLYRRAPHPEVLPVARSESVSREAYRASLMLLERAGHAVSFAALRRPSHPVLLEVLAPAVLELPRAGRVELRPLSRTGRDRIKARGELLYECSYAVETSSAAEFLRRHELVRTAHPRGARLLLDRGHPELDGPAPFSLVDYEAQPRSLECFFVHAFPRDRAFVFVQTSIGVAP